MRTGPDLSGGLTTQNLNLHRAQPILKTWCYKAAIAAVLRDGDPLLMDALFQEPRETRTASDGKRIYGRDL